MKNRFTHQRKTALFCCQFNLFGMNRWKSMHCFKILVTLNIHGNICVWCEQALTVATLTFSLYGMQSRRNLNSHWSSCFMKELNAINWANHNIRYFFRLKYVSNRILTCRVKDSDRSALYCAHTGVHTDAVDRFRLQLRETVTAARSIYYVLFSLFIWAHMSREKSK